MDRYHIALGKEPPPEEPKKPRKKRVSKAKQLENKLVFDTINNNTDMDMWGNLAKSFTPQLMETYFDFVSMYGGSFEKR